LEEESKDPDFWNDQKRAADTSKELSDIKEEVEKVSSIEKELAELKEISKISDSDELKEEIENKIDLLEKTINQEEIKTYLSGKRDKGSAVISIYSGAGGQDAEDWATMLLRMYRRFCEDKGFDFKILDQSFGEGGGPEGRIGTKEATAEIKGKFAYGILKKENGVHRIVRLSPFSSQSLRHTSFALVEILPEITRDDQIEIKPEDIKLEVFRASGPGGQYVNKRESAVRIIHIPTGIRVTCQSERLQGRNREKAEALLYSKLYQRNKIEQKKELEKIKGSTSSASWGEQIRSYVLHPYKMVKDNRTEVKTNQVEDVLNGNLDEFIEAEIKLK
jgi:peptide chain release factor 2